MDELGPAAGACFSTTELLEAILLKLDCQALLRAEHTCRYIYDVVRKSSACQRKLLIEKQRRFLAPATLQESLDGSYVPGKPDRSISRVVQYFEEYEPPLCRAQYVMVNPNILALANTDLSEFGDGPLPEEMICMCSDYMFVVQCRKFPLTPFGDLDNSKGFYDMYLAHPTPLEVRFWIPVRETKGRFSPRFDTIEPPFMPFWLYYNGLEDGKPMRLGEMMHELEDKMWDHHELQPD